MKKGFTQEFCYLSTDWFEWLKFLMLYFSLFEYKNSPQGVMLSHWTVDDEMLFVKLKGLCCKPNLMQNISMIS